MDQDRDFRHAILALALGSLRSERRNLRGNGAVALFRRRSGISEPQASHVISAYALGVVVGAPLTLGSGARGCRGSAIWRR